MLHIADQAGEEPGGKGRPIGQGVAHDAAGFTAVEPLAERLAEIERELDAVTLERDALLHSKTWRYTAPLRRARGVVAGVRRRARNWRAKAQRALGGMAPSRWFPWSVPTQGGVETVWTPGHRMAQLQLYASASNMERSSLAQRQVAGTTVDAAVVTAGLSVCILNLNKPELILPLVADLLEVHRPQFLARGLGFEVIIGDTGSTHPEVLELYARPPEGLKIRRGLAYQFSKCNNLLAKHDATHESILFLNNDVLFTEAQAALTRMYDALHGAPAVGVVGSCLFFADGLVQHAGVDFLRDAEYAGLCFHPHAKKRVVPEAFFAALRVPAATGACLMVKRDVFLAAGGMDEGYAAECQDIALCLTADRLGYETYVVNAGPVVHLENATRTRGEENWPDRQRFLRHWGTYIEARFL